ncbi:MAG: hypothetical protein AAF063_31495 [Cyanobacteria bacterium J06643_5]
MQLATDNAAFNSYFIIVQNTTTKVVTQLHSDFIVVFGNLQCKFDKSVYLFRITSVFLLNLILHRRFSQPQHDNTKMLKDYRVMNFTVISYQ